MEELGRQLQLTWHNTQDLFSNPQVVEERGRVAELTDKLAHHERIKDIRVVAGQVSQSSGLLTPTLKVKRKEVEQRFPREIIDDMYAKIDRSHER